MDLMLLSLTPIQEGLIASNFFRILSTRLAIVRFQIGIGEAVTFLEQDPPCLTEIHFRDFCKLVLVGDNSSPNPLEHCVGSCQ